MYDELIKRLRSQCQGYGKECEDCNADGNCRSQMENDAADTIEELMRRCEQFQYMPPPAWIPVTERLPEDGSDILAVQSYCGEVRIVPANYDRGVWYDCVFNRVAEHITHWMPLPEPPKEET